MNALSASRSSHRRAWRTINISLAERIGRVLLGMTAVTAAAVLLAHASAAVAVALEILLAVAGLDLIVTGALGHCPLYAKLGHVPRSLRSPR